MGGSGEMREEILGFLHYDLGLSWKVLAETVLNGIANLALDIYNCRRKGYYEAFFVLSAQILCRNEKVIDNYC